MPALVFDFTKPEQTPQRLSKPASRFQPRQVLPMFSNFLAHTARLCSILGGLLMTGLMLMTCYSLISRNFFDTALIGDFELTGVGAGAAIALFMPLCQLKKENIIVDFFTSKCSSRVNEGLDRMGALLMAVIFALLSWRCGLAAINAKETMGASMLLGFPDWIVFTSMCIPFGITSLIALMQALSSMDHLDEAAA
jgi:TRAP-type C4-dicarboxylate transport system permease small subunit